MEKLVLESVKQKVVDYLNVKDKFNIYDLVYKNENYLYNREFQYNETNPFAKDKTIVKIFNDKYNKDFYFDYKGKNEGFISSNNPKKCFKNSSELLEYFMISKEDTNEIINKANKFYINEMMNSQAESNVFYYYYDKFDLDRSKTNLYEDFIWAKEHNISNKIIDELFFDLENKISITLNESSLKEIEQAKDFIVLQGSEFLYNYLIQEKQEIYKNIIFKY